MLPVLLSGLFEMLVILRSCCLIVIVRFLPCGLSIQKHLASQPSHPSGESSRETRKQGRQAGGDGLEGFPVDGVRILGGLKEHDNVHNVPLTGCVDEV